MQLGGYYINGVGSFQKHFSVPDLLDVIDIKVPFEDWIELLLFSGSLDDNQLRLVQNVSRDFSLWKEYMISGETPKAEELHDDDHLEQKGNSLYSKWREDVIPERMSAYLVFCRLFEVLLVLGNYSPTLEDLQQIQSYLNKRDLFVKREPEHTSFLKIKNVGDGQNGLFYQEDCVFTFPSVDSVMYKRDKIIYVVEHPDTGYIGITQDGLLVNCSAFDIPVPVNKVVKVCLNQRAYAILLENGEIITNLTFMSLPVAFAENIDLNGAKLLITTSTGTIEINGNGEVGERNADL